MNSKLYFSLFLSLFLSLLSAQDCHLSDMTAIVTPCNPEGKFYVTIDFKHENNGECFKLKGNGINYGTFNYNLLPLKIGPLKGDCTTPYEFLAIDCKTETCHTSKQIGTVCCTTKKECKIYDVKLEKTNCNSESLFYVYLNFKYENVSDCFKVSGNGNNYGVFKYINLPIKIGPLKGDCSLEYGFLIRDCADEHCAEDISLGKVCCEDSCKIKELKWTKSDCDTNQQFFVTINFTHQGGSDSFNLYGLGLPTTKYAYASLPIKVGPLKGDCTTQYEFKVQDHKIHDCYLGASVGKVCCAQQGDCKIYDAEFEKSDCNDEGFFYVTINFKYQGNSECFRLKGNDHNYGEFLYADLPIKIGPFKGDCTTNYNFVISDCENEHCLTELNIGKVCCKENEDCKIYDVKYEKTACNDDGNFYVYLKFSYKGQSECFTVKGNDHNYGEFKYTQLPIKLGPFKGDCTTEYHFVITDCANEHCTAEINIGKVCCEQQGDCKIYDVKFDKLDCNEEGFFYLTINFQYKGNSDCFRIKGKDHNYGEFLYADLPVKIGPFKGDCTTEYNFVISDCENEHCLAEINVGKVCCEENEDCKIYDVKYEKTACNDDGNFYVYLKFSYKGQSECFTVKGNDHNYGEFKYTQLPIKLGPFKGDCSTEYNFIITDCANENCTAEINIGKVCCEQQGDCKIYDVKYEKSDCNEEGFFFVTLNFLYKGNSDCFRIKGNDHNYGEFLYADLPVKIGPLKGDCTTNYNFVISDCENEHCAAELNIGKVCCEKNEDCKIYDVKYEKTACNDDGNFYVYLKFSYKGQSECFTIKGNDHNYGEFKYSLLPIKLGPFKGDCTTEYNFVITDCADEHCSAELNIGKVCCEKNEDCKIYDLVIEKSACDTNKKFNVTIIFKYQNTSDSFFLKVGGVFYGTFAYTQVPLTIGPLMGDCQTVYGFAIIDQAKKECGIDKSIGKVCCESSTDCKLSELKIEKSDCDDHQKFKVTINFNRQNTSDSFYVKGNGKLYGIFAYNQLPITLGPLAGDCLTNYEFLILDKEKKDCSISKSIGKVCCEKGELCSINELKVDRLHCTGPGEYSIKINFAFKGTNSAGFDLYDRNGHLGYYPYSSLPLTIPNFKKSTSSNDYLKVCDHEISNCCKAIEFEPLNCFGKEKEFHVYEMKASNTGSKIHFTSEVEIPDILDIKLYDITGRICPIEKIEKSLYEIYITPAGNVEGIYFLKGSWKNQVESIKFYQGK